MADNKKMASGEALMRRSELAEIANKMSACWENDDLIVLPIAAELLAQALGLFGIGDDRLIVERIIRTYRGIEK